mgnify:CR=1 FL=1
MTIDGILSLLEDVSGVDGQYKARCPAHDDSKPSLSVSLGEDGRVLLHCHAGCAPECIVDALGLTMKDLFVEDAPAFPACPAPAKGQSPVVAVYDFRDDAGKLIAQKLRRADKSFLWRQPDGKGGWVNNRKGVPHRLYVAGALSGVVMVAEGEKDADTLHGLGYDAASGADGAGNKKWRKEYTEQLRGRHVCVFQDNDEVGKAYALETCTALHGVAASVRLLDLSKVWPELPDKGDVSDLVAAVGQERAAELLAGLIAQTSEWEPQRDDPFLCLFKPLGDFPEEEPEWLVPGWIPRGQISLIAADGGVGKTTLWCHIIAALSCGRTCILDPPGVVRDPLRIAFMTTEDSVRKKLRRKLRLAGANMGNIITPDFVGDRSGLLHRLKFGSPEMERALRYFKPALCVFDPVQGFTPPKVNMGSRNEMRDCMAPLITIGEELNTTSLIVCHTNKRKGAYGRDRIADSADLWDISRSVLMAGPTEEQGIRYLSNEKNNYAPLQDTVLFTIDKDEQIRRTGTSWKRDRDYILDADLARSRPKREDCKAFLLRTIGEAGGSMATKELEEAAQKAGYAAKTIRNAKEELKKEGEIRYFSIGGNSNKTWYVQRQTRFGAEDEDEPEDPWKEETPSDI